MLEKKKILLSAALILSQQVASLAGSSSAMTKQSELQAQLKELFIAAGKVQKQDKLMHAWLQAQHGILSRLIADIETDRTGGNMARADSEVKDFSVMTRRIRSELDFLRTAPDLSANGRLNVKDFGAKGDGLTDDTVAIHCAIEAALKGKIRTLFMPAGKYVVKVHPEIKPPNFPWGKGRPVVPDDYHPGNYGAILIHGENLLITGEPGTELVCGSPQDTAIHIVNSNNIRISNLKIGYSKRSQVSGKIVKIVSRDEVDVELEPGSGNPTESYFRERGFKGLCRFYSEGHQPGGNRPEFSNDAIHQKSPAVKKITAKIYRFKFHSALPVSKTYRVGQHMTYYGRTYIDHAIVNYNSSRTRLHNIHISSSPAIAINCFNSPMPFVTNCTVEAVPGQYASTSADGFYFKSGWGGYVAGNIFKNLGDDFFNIHVRLNPIYRQEGRNLYLYMKIWPEKLWSSTSRLGYVLTGSGQCDLRGEFGILKYEPVTVFDKGRKLMLVKVTSDRELPRFVTKTNCKSGQLTDMISMPDFNWQGLVITGNRFEHGVSRILFGGRNVNVTNNVFIDSLNSHTLGFSSMEPTASGEGRFCRNILLAGNHFESKAKTILSFKSRLKISSKSDAKRDKNAAHFIISGNTINSFGDSPHPLFVIDDVDYLTFSGNKISASGNFSAPVLTLQNSLHIKIENNMVNGLFQSFISNLGACGHIVSNGNKLVLKK